MINTSRMIQRNERDTLNKCSISESLSNILIRSKSSQSLQLRRIQSLHSCFKFTQDYNQYYKIISVSSKENYEKKRSDPTIGELLGDDDLFHYRYHDYYSSSRSKRKRHYYHHRSYSRSSTIHVRYDRRKHQRSTYSNTIQESPHPSPSKLFESIPDVHQLHSYPTTYNYTSIPSYYYPCCANLTSYCTCLVSDYYGGFSQQETYYPN